VITLGTIIGTIAALIFGAVGLWFGGKSRGKSEQKAKSDTQQARQSVAKEKARTESVKVANDVKDEVMRSNPDSVRDKLRDEWTRPGH
jgi:Sec-independent protein translocase protein TatA